MLPRGSCCGNSTLVFFCDLKGLSPLPSPFPSLGSPAAQSRVKGDSTTTWAGKWARPKPCLPEAEQLATGGGRTGDRLSLIPTGKQ